MQLVCGILEASAVRSTIVDVLEAITGAEGRERLA